MVGASRYSDSCRGRLAGDGVGKIDARLAGLIAGKPAPAGTGVFKDCESQKRKNPLSRVFGGLQNL
ncbi:hypothetical protein CCU68_32160 [Pseudomonas gingeri NCPPB 3146 = LMG 5327]|uniref:Uncharacterized protein n=1 Tax=Pseudomonas gingeri NCPPB 3146 = LMG 5327 TaxID=707248 RepID=A0ABX4XTQ9_9PSED|nr:hypothetical protein CCU68_32160 [Pseudomonas gingeri NCPPB 3146 = LMG 5327]